LIFATSRKVESKGAKRIVISPWSLTHRHFLENPFHKSPRRSGIRIREAINLERLILKRPSPESTPQEQIMTSLGVTLDLF
jgi:hypothetical protein